MIKFVVINSSTKQVVAVINNRLRKGKISYSKEIAGATSATF